MINIVKNLPDFILICWGNCARNDRLIKAIDNELQARYDSIKEELKAYANELPF